MTVTHSPFGLNDSQIIMVRAAGIIGMIASPFAGLLVRKFSAVKFVRGGLLLAAAGLVLIGISASLPALSL